MGGLHCRGRATAAASPIGRSAIARARRLCYRCAGMTYRPPALTAWLWWTALLVLVTGGAIYYILRLDTMNTEAMAQGNLVLAFTGVVAGICVIAATSKWWLSR